MSEGGQGSWKVFEIRICSCLEMSGSLVPLVTGGHFPSFQSTGPGPRAQSCSFLTTLLCAGHSEFHLFLTCGNGCGHLDSAGRAALEDEIWDSRCFRCLMKTKARVYRLPAVWGPWIKGHDLFGLLCPHHCVVVEWRRGPEVGGV